MSSLTMDYFKVCFWIFQIRGDFPYFCNWFRELNPIMIQVLEHFLFFSIYQGLFCSPEYILLGWVFHVYLRKISILLLLCRMFYKCQPGQDAGSAVQAIHIVTYFPPTCSVKHWGCTAENSDIYCVFVLPFNPIRFCLYNLNFCSMYTYLGWLLTVSYSSQLHQEYFLGFSSNFPEGSMVCGQESCRKVWLSLLFICRDFSILTCSL